MAATALQKMQNKYRGSEPAMPAEVKQIPLGDNAAGASHDRRQSEASDQAAGMAESGLPEKVKELKAILDADKLLKVMATVKRTALLYPIHSTNQEVLERLSTLVFFDPDCWAFLHAHPAEIIDHGNFELQ